MSSKCLKVYWASGLKSGKPNFGDALSPLLCELLSGRPAVHTRPNRCDLVAIGSILHRVSHRWFSRKVHVWGTGLMEQKTPFPSRHHYHALRGRLTQACLRHEGNPFLATQACCATCCWTIRRESSIRWAWRRTTPTRTARSFASSSPATRTRCWWTSSTSRAL